MGWKIFFGPNFFFGHKKFLEKVFFVEKIKNFWVKNFFLGRVGGWSYCAYIANLSPINWNWTWINWDWAWQFSAKKKILVSEHFLLAKISSQEKFLVSKILMVNFLGEFLLLMLWQSKIKSTLSEVSLSLTHNEYRKTLRRTLSSGWGSRSQKFSSLSLPDHDFLGKPQSSFPDHLACDR